MRKIVSIGFENTIYNHIEMFQNIIGKNSDKYKYIIVSEQENTDINRKEIEESLRKINIEYDGLILAESWIGKVKAIAELNPSYHFDSEDRTITFLNRYTDGISLIVV